MIDQNWAEQKRIKIVVDESLSDISKQMKKLKGKDLYSLQSEFLEWFSTDYDELSIEWSNHWDWWSRQ